MESIGSIARQIICIPIKCYQYVISPWVPSCCRFYPSCSQYALLAIKYHGIGKGILFTCYRLLRCHPWAQGGYDPILPPEEN